jgi:hypothetical protein
VRRGHATGRRFGRNRLPNDSSAERCGAAIANRVVLVDHQDQGTAYTFAFIGNPIIRAMTDTLHHLKITLMPV